jgi:hypothetical protein
MVPRRNRDPAMLVDRVAEAEKLARVAEGLDPARTGQRNEQVNAVATDIDARADGNGRMRARLARCDWRRNQGRTVSQRPFQAGALRWTFSVNLFLSSL